MRALNLKERDNERKDKKLKAEEEKLGVAPVALLNMTGIDYPVSQKKIDKFEKNNPYISFNVFGYECNVYALKIGIPSGVLSKYSDRVKKSKTFCLFLMMKNALLSHQ